MEIYQKGLNWNENSKRGQVLTCDNKLEAANSPKNIPPNYAKASMGRRGKVARFADESRKGVLRTQMITDRKMQMIADYRLKKRKSH